MFITSDEQLVTSLSSSMKNAENRDWAVCSSIQGEVCSKFGWKPCLLLWGHLLLLIYLFVCVCFFLCVIGAFIVGTYCCTARAWDNISATMAYVIWRSVSVLQRIPISGFFQFFLSLFVPPFVCLLPYLFVCRIVYRLVGFIEGLTCFVE